ncbi:MAG: hypothetical protein NCW75_12150 [Phycisphaera sp.]|nr:MAG: hypothetical protein NCW75_12150 [Phycisphaera sp.]
MHRTGRRTRTLAALVVIAGLANGVLGQDDPVGIDPLAITGEGFGPVRLPAAQGLDTIEVAGQRAWAWNEASLTTGVAPTRRLVLEGDVRMVLGTLELRARRLHAWVQGLPDGGQQFYILLEDANMPTGAPGSGVAGPIIPIEGSLAPGAKVDLSSIVLEQAPPAGSGETGRAVAMAQGVFTDRLRQVVGIALPEVSGEMLAAEDAALRGVLQLARERLGALDVREPILPVRGRVSFSAAGIEQVRLGDGSDGSDGSPPYAVVLRGPVAIMFTDIAGGRRAQLTAQDAVLFHKADLVGAPRLDAGDVMGVYLEGEVVADIERDRAGQRGGIDRYRVRSPRVYYDLAGDRALLLDAIFRAEPAGSPVPIYVRAGEIRQRSLKEVTATDARLTTTGFFRPHLALGASTLTLRSEDAADGGTRMIADARNITVRAAGVPFLYWPIYVGDPSQIPLRNIGFETSDRHGEVVRTAWDGFALTGANQPAGVDLDLLIDAYFQRGAGLGGELSWQDRAGGDGSLFVYNLFNDTGRDLLPTGARIDRDGENRTLAMLEHLGRLDDRWTLRAEASWFGDENVVGAFFPAMTFNEREPMTGASVQRIDESSMLMLGANVQLNDFLVSDYQLRSRGYITERLPELRYARPGDDLLSDSSPGLLTYRSDSRVGQLRLSFTEPTAAELGFVRTSRAQAALGIDPGQSPGDRLRAQGLTESSIFRFDTQHEISSQFEIGVVRVQPFVTGRLTGYDTDFDGFSAVSGEDADSLVASGAVGTRFSTQLTRVYDNVDVPVLDLYRVRHVIEPNATLWYGDSTVAQGAIPVYDEYVETFARGPAIRFGVDQTFQTMRGSLGSYESVDVLKLGTHLVFAGEDRPDEDRTPRFFDAYPERSQFGDSLDLEAAWRPTDVLGITGQFIYDLEANRAAEGVFGIEIEQWPDMRLFTELRRLGYSEDTYVNAGLDYQLGDRYSLGAVGVYNERAGQFQSATFRVGREMPHLILTGRLTYNDITGDTAIGFDFQPTGIDPRREQVRRLGAATLGY